MSHYPFEQEQYWIKIDSGSEEISLEMGRKGFTTGSCAAAAAKAAAWMLLTGRDRDKIDIETPAGIRFSAELLNRRREVDLASCGIRKDGGDDPDITTGLIIFAEVKRDDTGLAAPFSVMIRGGEGVGRVTAPGLDQPVGEAAINHVPREMIIKEVRGVMELLDESCPLTVTIFVPGGRETAEKTFNPRLGIEGGISILGTSGIVEPMSDAALIETIRLELRQKYALGQRIAVVTPGNYGMDMLKRAYNYDLDRAVKCSNFIGDTIDMASEEGYPRMVLLGHMGKLVKCAAGVMNTHSKYGDRRMETLSAAALELGEDKTLCENILSCVSTEAALDLLGKEEGRRVSERILEQALEHIRNRAAGRIEPEMIIYTNQQGILAESERAVEWLHMVM